MASFDLKYIQCAPYQFSEGKVSYGEKVKVGEAMNADIAFTFAEGRLYAEGKLSEYIKEITGGTISIAVKDIAQDAQKTMYGASEKNRTISDAPIKGIVYTAKDSASYVGISFYCKDRVDGATKFTCILAVKSLFGPPSMNKATKGQNITFSTPSTTGEFLPADDDEQAVIEVAIADDEEAAKSWCDAVLTSYTPEMASLMAEEPGTTDGSDPVQDTNAEEPNEPEVTENG